MSVLQLPKSTPSERERLINALNSMLDPALAERNVWQIGWWVADAYFRGLRHFHVVDYERGEMAINYEDPDGNLELRWDEPLTKMTTEIGRLAQLDTNPAVRKTRQSLESLSNASASQVLLDAAVSGHDVEAMKLEVCHLLCQYGTAGLAAWPSPYQTAEFSQLFEVIPPWELLAFPADSSTNASRKGVCRTRLMPLRQLRELADSKVLKLPPTDKLDLMDLTILPFGHNTSWAESRDQFGFDNKSRRSGPLSSLRTSAENRFRPGGNKKIEDAHEDEIYVKLREWYVTGTEGRLARTIWHSKDWIFKDDNFFGDGDYTVPFPIGIAKYDDIGRFYGRSFASKIIPFAMELERLMTQLMQNMRDLDRFGFLMIPHDAGVDDNVFKATFDGSPRRVYYNYDPFSNARDPVQQIQPVNTSDVPGRVAQFGLQVADRTIAQGPLFQGQAAGRADSGEAFSILAEMGSTNLIPVAGRINSAYGAMYRTALFNIVQEIGESPQAATAAIEITRVDNTLAGLTFDGTRVQVLPHTLDPWALNIGIRSQDPTAAERERQEAVFMLDRQQLSPLEFVIMNYKNNWGYPIGQRDLYENYLKAVLWNLILFNDGQQPGELPSEGGVFLNAADRPEAHLHALNEFMATTQFSMASSDVQAKFVERLDAAKDWLGVPRQSNLPPLEDAAVQAQQIQSLQRQTARTLAEAQGGVSPELLDPSGG